MATLVLGAVGTAIGGSLISGTVLGFTGAAIGGFVGSTIGSVVDSWIVSSLTPGQRIEGARLDSLRITSSTEGAILPRVYGRMRMGGNLIWATDFSGGDAHDPPGRWQRRWSKCYHHRIPLLRQLRGGDLRGPNQRNRPHLGRWQAYGYGGRGLALVPGRRGPVA